MTSSRFTEEHLVRILQKADRDPAAQVVKHHEVPKPSIYAWHKKFGDLGTDAVKRLKQLKPVSGHSCEFHQNFDQITDRSVAPKLVTLTPMRISESPPPRSTLISVPTWVMRDVSSAVVLNP